MRPYPPSPQRRYTLTRASDGTPRFAKSTGSHDDNLSVMAALRKRFLAVLPLNSSLSGWPSGEGSVFGAENRRVMVLALVEVNGLDYDGAIWGDD